MILISVEVFLLSAARAGLLRILMSLPLPQRRALQMFYVEHTGEATASEAAGLSISRFSALRATVHQRFLNLTKARKMGVFSKLKISNIFG